MAKKTDRPDYDRDGLEEAVKESIQMVSDYAVLRENQRLCEDAYFMDWKDRPDDKNIKLTISPDPFNKVTGVVRLLTATSPSFNVPVEKNQADAVDKSSICEKAANAMWIGSNLVQGIVVEKDMAHAAALYGEMHLRVISTKDMLEAAQKAQNENKNKDKEAVLEANVKHVEDIRKKTPYLFTPLDSTTCFVRRSQAGLEAHYQHIQTTVADVLAAWGGDAQRVLKDKKPWQIIDLNIFYDRSNCYVWVTSSSKDPIFAGPHGLSFIPIAFYATEGSSIYSQPERRITPFLYAAIKSGVWQRQNLFLTVSATNAAALMNAQFIFEQGSTDAVPTINHNIIGGVAIIPQGSRLSPMAKEIVNPELMNLYQMYDGLMNESTIFDQTLGEPLGSGNQPFSSIALLNQAGRLPLAPIQEGMATLFANAMGIAFEWMKKDGKANLYTKTGEGIEISSEQIPDVLNWKVTVDADLPQDKMQQANVGAALKGSGLASNEWIRNSILNIGQSDMEQSKIWKEQMADMAAKTLFPQFMQMMAAKMGLLPQQPGQPGQSGQPGQPGQEQPPEGQPTPEQIAQMQQGPQQQPVPPAQPEQPIPSGQVPNA